MNAIVVEHISKNYGAIQALKEISFHVKKGELFGLIGPDGAGKTSLFRILTTLMLADQGTATVNGLDVVKDYKKIRQMVGYMPGRFSLYQDLTVEENLQFFATIFNTTIEKNYHLIKDIYVQLEPFRKRPAGKLSGGMKQKLALCCALVHEPSILFLDEPTTGVDPVSRKEFWEMLKRLRDNGIAIMVSTPYMDEADLCERVALIQAGQILQINSPANIVADFEKDIYGVKGEHMHALLQTARSYPGTFSCFAFGDQLHLVLKDGETNSLGVQQYLSDHINGDFTLQKIEPGIEDCFMYLMEK